MQVSRARVVAKAPRAATRAAAVVPRAPVPVRARPDVRMAAAQADQPTSDFDALLNSLAEKFEKVPSDKKAIVVGYLAGSVTAVVFAEWLIHLPALDILLGWPVQLVGLLALPVLGVRYFLDNKDWNRELTSVVEDIANRLPGLKK